MSAPGPQGAGWDVPSDVQTIGAWCAYVNDITNGSPIVRRRQFEREVNGLPESCGRGVSAKGTTARILHGQGLFWIDIGKGDADEPGTATNGQCCDFNDLGGAAGGD